MSNVVYKPQTFNLSGLNGISDGTLAMHFKLYEGYVTNTNLLNEQIAEMAKGEITAKEMPVFSELTRRLGFEYNGMVLHEWYFGNMIKGGSGDPDKNSPFYKAAEVSFGSYENWKKNFVTTGKMRGVGWAACYLDPVAKRLSNHWIPREGGGSAGGFSPFLIREVWEHAFTRDSAPADRQKYSEAFFKNINGGAGEEGLAKRGAARPAVIG